jgi:HSP20 family protein
MSEKLDENKVEDVEINDEKKLKDETTEKTEEETIENEEETNTKTKKLQTQAEQVLDDVISTFKEKRDEMSKSINSYSASRARPLVDLIETEDKYILKAEINNVKKEDITLEATNKSLELNVKFGDDEELEEGKYLIKEITKGMVTRKILLKSEIDVESISAEFKNNILEIIIEFGGNRFYINFIF